MIKQFDLKFGTVKIYDRILVSELNEGILFDVESNRKLLSIGEEEFGGEAYGYISHRKTSYAVDPMVYRESAEYENLKAIAVITGSEIGFRSARVERTFYKNKNSFEIFTSFEEASEWIQQCLNP